MGKLVNISLFDGIEVPFGKFENRVRLCNKAPLQNRTTPLVKNYMFDSFTNNSVVLGLP